MSFVCPMHIMTDDKKGFIRDHDDNKWKDPGWNWLERLLNVRVLNNGDWVLTAGHTFKKQKFVGFK